MAWREKPLVNVGAGATGGAEAPESAPEKFFLNNGLALSVESGDITRKAGNAVVVGEDSDFSGRGAVARALINAGGVEYERNRESLKGQIQRGGLKHVVYRCPAGNCFYFREVFHAIIFIGGYKIPDWGKHLEQLFYDVGFQADTSSYSTVVTPLLGAGMARGTVDVSLQALVNGLSKFAPQHLKEVIIVEYDENKAAEIREKLKQIVSQAERQRQGQLQESERRAGGNFPGNPNQSAQGTSANSQTLLSKAQAWVSASGGYPTNKGASGGTGHGHMGRGGGGRGGGGTGQPSSHQRTPTNSAEQQRGNPQNDPFENLQPAVDNLIDEFSELAIRRQKDNTNQKNIQDSTAQNTRTPSGGTSQIDRQTTSRQSGRGRGLLVQTKSQEGSPVDGPVGRDQQPKENSDLFKEDNYMDNYFGDGTQRPKQPNSSGTSKNHSQSGQRDNSAEKGRGRESKNPDGDGRGRQGGGGGNKNPGATPRAAGGSDKGRPAGKNGQNRRSGKGSGGWEDPKDNSATENRNRGVAESGQDPIPATSPGFHRGAHGGSGLWTQPTPPQGMGRGAAPPSKNLQGPGGVERIDTKSGAATPSRSRESGGQGGGDNHKRGDNERKKKGDNPPAIESSPKVSMPPSQLAAPGQRPRDTAAHTVRGEDSESDEEVPSQGSSARTREKGDDVGGKTQAGGADHSSGKRDQQPDMTVQSGYPSPRHATTAQTAQGPRLTRPTPFVPNDTRGGRKNEETQRNATALPRKSNEDPLTGSQQGGGYPENEDEISNDYVQPAKSNQMEGQNRQQTDADLKDRAKNKEREEDPNRAGRNEGNGRREKEKEKKPTKGQEPKRKATSDSKGPEHSAARPGQGATAEEPDFAEADFTGSMPDGKMVVSDKPKLHLEGFPNCGTILIEYSFPNGVQGPQHPEPGQPYKGTFRRAYLPDNEVGRRVSLLLKKAFDRKLTFHLERSDTNEEWVVEFDDIPHKTSLRGGKEGRGYPDHGYLTDVLKALADYGVKDTAPKKTGSPQDDEEQREKEPGLSAEARSDKRVDDEADWSMNTGPQQTELTQQRSKAGGRGVRDVAPLEGEGANLPGGIATTERGGGGGAQQNVQSKMWTSRETITLTTKKTWSSTNVQEEPSSPPSSPPLDKKSERKQKRAHRNAVLSALQAGRKEDEKRRSNQSTPAVKNGDQQGKDSANGRRSEEGHTGSPPEPSTTSAERQEELALEKSKVGTTPQKKKEALKDTSTEPGTALTHDESHKESINQESEDDPTAKKKGEKDRDAEANLRAAAIPAGDPDAATNPEIEASTTGQRNGATLTEPKIAPSSDESQVHSTNQGNEDTTNGQDRDTEAGHRTPHTSDENPEKSIKPGNEVDSREQKKEEGDTGSATKPRTPSTTKKAPEASTASGVEDSTSGQRRSKPRSDSLPEPRPAPTPAEGREEPPADSHTASTSDGPEKSAKSESEDSTSRQKNEERDAVSTEEARAPSTTEKAPEASTASGVEVSTSGQRKSKTCSDSPPDSRPAPTPAEGGEEPPADSKTASTSDEGAEKSTKPEVDTSGENKRENDTDPPTEPRALTSLPENPEASTNPEQEATASGQKNDELGTLRGPRAPAGPENPEASTNPEEEESASGQRKDELDTPASAEIPSASGNLESEDSTSGQMNKEGDASSTAEPRAPSTPEKAPEESATSGDEVSTSGLRKSKTGSDSPSGSGPAPTPAGGRKVPSAASTSDSHEKSVKLESEVDTRAQKNGERGERDAGSTAEPGAPSTREKPPEQSATSEVRVRKSGQRRSKTHSDSQPSSSINPSPDGDPEASSTSQSKDGMRGQTKREVDPGTPTDTISALAPAEDPARPYNPERVTEEGGHFHPERLEKPEADDGEAEAKSDDPEAEVKNQPEEAKPEAGKPAEKGEDEEKDSSKETGTDPKIVGNMPLGEMKVTFRKKVSVPGYDDCGVLVIDYYISKGKQRAGHPEPGSPYSGCVERAFLPNNEEGERVRTLLQKAFDRKLTFQLQQTGPDGEWVVEFADIPHKTSLRGGPERGGYPDPGYLERVQSVLRDKYGIE